MVGQVASDEVEELMYEDEDELVYEEEEELAAEEEEELASEEEDELAPEEAAEDELASEEEDVVVWALDRVVSVAGRAMWQTVECTHATNEAAHAARTRNFMVDMEWVWLTED